MTRPTDTAVGAPWTRPVRIIPALVWACVIFAASSLPGSQIPGRFAFPGHLVEYTVFGALVLLAMTRPGAERRTALLALAVCSAYAITDEVHQAFVPGRTPDLLDWAVDTLGSALGIGACLLAARWRASRRAA